MFRGIEGKVIFIGRSAALGSFPGGKNHPVVLPDEGLACGLLLVLLQGSMGPQTQARSLSLRASSMRSHRMSWGCDASCAYECMLIPTTEEGTLR